MSQRGLLWPDGRDAQHAERCQASLGRLGEGKPEAMRQALTDYQQALSRVHHGIEFLDFDLAELTARPRRLRHRERSLHHSATI